jgi:hypothetical protein
MTLDKMTEKHGRDNPGRHKLSGILWRPYLHAWRDVRDSLDVLLAREQESSSLRTWLTAMAGILICWQIYVPIHEFLHVAGCLLGGGQVSRLEISPWYGGRVFEAVIPFVKSSSDYAGRLSGFDTGGSDLCYLLTVGLPYVLTIFLGVPALRCAVRRKSLFLFGSGLILSAVPFLSLTGDYLELGGILVTRATSGLVALSGTGTNLVADPTIYRSDDLFRLIGDMAAEPLKFGLCSWSGRIGAVVIVILSLMTGAILAGWTYEASRFLSGKREE